MRVGLTIDVSTIFHITIPWLWQSAVKTDDNYSWKGQLTVLQQKLVTFWQMPKTLATRVGWPVRILINGKKVFDMPSQSGYMSCGDLTRCNSFHFSLGHYVTSQTFTFTFMNFCLRSSLKDGIVRVRVWHIPLRYSIFQSTSSRKRNQKAFKTVISYVSECIDCAKANS